MKYLKYLLIILLILSFTLVSCKKDSTTGPAGSGALVGTWQVVDAVVGWLLTTNSNQVATNMFDVSGQVSVAGSVNGTLDYMIIDDSTNPPSFILGDITNNALTVFLDGSSGEGMVLNNATGQAFLGNVTFAYNNGALTITQSTITDVASAATITLSGVISFSQTNIPANTPTFLQFATDEDGEEAIGFSTMEFRNDGTATVTTVDEFGTDTENWTYVTDGNQMTITDEFNEKMVFEYTISGNTLTLAATDFEDICLDYNNQAECFADMEFFFILAQGSLTDIKMKVEIILNKATAKPGYAVQIGFNLLNPKYTISNYIEKVKQLKEIQ